MDTPDIINTEPGEPVVGHTPDGTFVYVIFQDVTMMLPRKVARGIYSQLGHVLMDLDLTDIPDDFFEDPVL